MRFDIKKWQNKYLIKESKLKKEIDFKDQEAFKKYSAKHKMRPTTKVTIGGKPTTAGDATKKTPKETPKDSSADTYKYGSNPEAENQAYGAVEMLGDILTADMGYSRDEMQGELEQLKDTGISKEQAKNLMDAEISNIEKNYDPEEFDGEEAYPQYVKDELYKHLDDVYGDIDESKKDAPEKKLEAKMYKSIQELKGLGN